MKTKTAAKAKSATTTTKAPAKAAAPTENLARAMKAGAPAKAAVVKAVTDQLSAIVAKKGLKATAASKAALATEPVHMDPKTIAKAAIQGKGKAKASAPAPAAPAPTKRKEPELPTLVAQLLRDVQAGKTNLYGFPSKKAGGTDPWWLYAGAVPGTHEKDERRVMFSKIQPLVAIAKVEEESGMLLYQVSAQGKQALAAA